MLYIMVLIADAMEGLQKKSSVEKGSRAALKKFRCSGDSDSVALWGESI